ncbi:ATP-binding cassette domain-containing protein [Intrasporangium calvum]|uniref:ABC transporter related protein n=1 Tax=Intrasporangium calvum (strain ATCC 23552 / DSM 43043 / JCM 3097 / NBRC 12989 / NCIMB 10167 / NRRL B-3866 / 7 KIP) TaxID=710696 RepID=E6SBE8_INTC7|nr:ABC transporter ATP-binding protein [Intrasporangium calvum]ADU49476.1 ABC transporter related protein [Intrasporangium calvum DSM 43043]AXG14406.1 ABC transporter ATP-binding protein [Intrasporangium calvum]
MSSNAQLTTGPEALEPGQGPPPVLDATGVAKAYTRWRRLSRRKVPVLTGADLALAAGEVVGLVGENGSGKTTLMRILVGDLAADSGTVRLSGTMGYCPQQPIVYPRLTCDEHFELFGAAHGMRPAAQRDATGDLYAQLGFERYSSTRADQLSGGTLAKLNLGLALLPDPDVLLLDEPYAGFDWDTYQKFWGMVAERRTRGRSVLIISHFIADEQRFDRVIKLSDGRTWSS